MQCDKLKENCVTVSVTWRCVICVNITFAWGHQWHLGTHLFISGSDTITPALSPHEPLTSITHYHSYYLLFIPKITRLYSSLLSSQTQFSLVVRMSGFWWEPRYESPGPELHLSLISWYFWQEFVMWPLASWVSEAWREERRRDQWMAGTRARWALAWCEVCHCLYLPNQQSPLCHCPPPAVKMFECPHNTKLTRKWRQYTLFYTAPPHQAEHKWR